MSGRDEHQESDDTNPRRRRSKVSKKLDESNKETVTIDEAELPESMKKWGSEGLQGLTPEEREEIWDYLDAHRSVDQLKQISKFIGVSTSSLKAFLSREPGRTGKPLDQRKEIGKEIDRKEKDTLKEFVGDQWEQFKSIATDVIKQYSPRAAEEGIEFKQYILNALQFYDTQHNKVVDLEETNMTLKALVKTLSEAFTPRYTKLSIETIYLRILADLIKQGAPQAVIDQLHALTIKFEVELTRQEAEKFGAATIPQSQ